MTTPWFKQMQERELAIYEQRKPIETININKPKETNFVDLTTKSPPPRRKSTTSDRINETNPMPRLSHDKTTKINAPMNAPISFLCGPHNTSTTMNVNTSTTTESNIDSIMREQKNNTTINTEQNKIDDDGDIKVVNEENKNNNNKANQKKKRSEKEEIDIDETDVDDGDTDVNDIDEEEKQEQQRKTTKIPVTVDDFNDASYEANTKYIEENKNNININQQQNDININQQQNIQQLSQKNTQLSQQNDINTQQQLSQQNDININQQQNIQQLSQQKEEIQKQDSNNNWKCFICNKNNIYQYKFCPECGQNRDKSKYGTTCWKSIKQHVSLLIGQDPNDKQNINNFNNLVQNFQILNDFKWNGSPLESINWLKISLYHYFPFLNMKVIEHIIDDITQTICQEYNQMWVRNQLIDDPGDTDTTITKEQWDKFILVFMEAQYTKQYTKTSKYCFMFVLFSIYLIIILSEFYFKFI